MSILSLYNDRQGLTSDSFKQGPNGDLGFRGFPGPKGPMGTLVSVMKAGTEDTPPGFIKVCYCKSNPSRGIL